MKYYLKLSLCRRCKNSEKKCLDCRENLLMTSPKHTCQRQKTTQDSVNNELNYFLFHKYKSPRECDAYQILHEIWMWSNQELVRYRAHKLSRWQFFSKCPPPAILQKNNQIIRSIQRTTVSNLNAIQPMVHKITHPQAFWSAIFSKYPPSAILF